MSVDIYPPPDDRWVKIGKNAYILPRDKMTKEEKKSLKLKIKKFKTKKVIKSIMDDIINNVIKTPEKKMRKCGNCGEIGHNCRKCPNPKIEKVITPNSKTRKNCDYNWAEFVICSIFLYPHIKEKNDILEKINEIKTDERLHIINGEVNIDKYVNDLKSKSSKVVKDYISNFNIENFDINFTNIFLTGKSFKDFPELVKLNTDKDTGKLYDGKITKSDIYISYSNSKFVGISVKDSEGATLTNYSIEKMFNILKINNDLKEKRINVLKNGLGENGYKYDKSQRTIANKLFYDKNNDYFKTIIEIIEKYNGIFQKKLLEYAFQKLNYDVYGYNGVKLVNLNELCDKNNKKKCSIKREIKYETNTSAKLWYSLYLDDIETWKFCIRGKNDIWRGSFQILEFTKV